MKLPKLPKIKITVIKKYRPEEVFGHEMRQSKSGKTIPPCQFFEEGQEFITNSFT
ncbi:MAG: hypothetical protein ACFFCZ_29165 [Promethearchaeota archaeon]